MKKWRVINIGIPLFFEALQYQDCEAVQIDWRTPVRRSGRLEELLERINAKGIREKADMANEEAVNCIIGSDPAWIDILPAGDVVEGTVDSIKPYGAFIKLDEGVDGLLHISQISTQRIKHPGAVLTEGQTVKVKILNTDNGKLSLSMKVLAEQTADQEAHETFDYKETGSVSTGRGDLLKGLKL